MDAKQYLESKGVFNLDTKKRYDEVISWMEDYADLKNKNNSCSELNTRSVKYFRVEYSYGKTGSGCSYFEAYNDNEQDIIENLAISIMKDDWEKVSNRYSILHSPTCPLPTIRVVQIDDTTKRKVKNGLDFKTKWR